MGIDLTKKIEKAKIVLDKKGLGGIKAQIVFAIDNSRSMHNDIENGIVQEQADRFIGLGINMSPTKSIDIYTFNNNSKYIGTANESNHQNFVRESGIHAAGGTNYSPVMHDIITKYGTAIKSQVVTETNTKEVESTGFFGKLFGKTKTVTETTKKIIPPSEVKPVNIPTLVLFMTDGDNFDRTETIHVIKEASKQGIFWQFIGIGKSSFTFLENLDDLQGRFIDNADFVAVRDIMEISDESLYDKVLTELPTWLNQAKQKGLIV